MFSLSRKVLYININGISIMHSCISFQILLSTCCEFWVTLVLAIPLSILPGIFKSHP